LATLALAIPEIFCLPRASTCCDQPIYKIGSSYLHHYEVTKSDAKYRKWMV